MHRRRSCGPGTGRRHASFRDERVFRRERRRSEVETRHPTLRPAASPSIAPVAAAAAASAPSSTRLAAVALSSAVFRGSAIRRCGLGRPLHLGVLRLVCAWPKLAPCSIVGCGRRPRARASPRRPRPVGGVGADRYRLRRPQLRASGAGQLLLRGTSPSPRLLNSSVAGVLEIVLFLGVGWRALLARPRLLPPRQCGLARPSRSGTAAVR